MTLIILAIIIGGIIGYFLDRKFKHERYFNNKVVMICVYLLFLIGITLFLGGMFLNNYVVEANGGKMPRDKEVLMKYNKEPIDDYKHGEVLKEPLYPKLIDRYYFPILAKLQDSLYSIGDLIADLGIVITLSFIVCIVRHIAIKRKIWSYDLI